MASNDLFKVLEEGEWNSLEDQCAALGELIGLEGPVEKDILLLAMQSEKFARQLLASRQAPVWREYLLKNPPDINGETDVQPLPQGSTRLMARAGKALLRWAHSGFLPPTMELIERREKACLSCPHLRPPENILQKVVSTAHFKDETGERAGNLVCGLCGCGVKNKMKLPTESCPDKHPKREGFSRWGERMQH